MFLIVCMVAGCMCARVGTTRTPQYATYTSSLGTNPRYGRTGGDRGGTWWDGEHKGAITGPFAEELREKRAAFESALEKLEELEDRCPNVPVFFLTIVP